MRGAQDKCSRTGRIYTSSQKSGGEAPAPLVTYMESGEGTVPQ